MEEVSDFIKINMTHFEHLQHPYNPNLQRPSYKRLYGGFIMRLWYIDSHCNDSVRAIIITTPKPLQVYRFTVQYTPVVTININTWCKTHGLPRCYTMVVPIVTVRLISFYTKKCALTRVCVFWNAHYDDKCHPYTTLLSMWISNSRY